MDLMKEGKLLANLTSTLPATVTLMNTSICQVTMILMVKLTIWLTTLGEMAMAEAIVCLSNMNQLSVSDQDEANLSSGSALDETLTPEKHQQLSMTDDWNQPTDEWQMTSDGCNDDNGSMKELIYDDGGGESNDPTSPYLI